MILRPLRACGCSLGRLGLSERIHELSASTTENLQLGRRDVTLGDSVVSPAFVRSGVNYQEHNLAVLREVVFTGGEIGD